MKDDFDKLLEKYMQDDEFKAEYEALELEYKGEEKGYGKNKCNHARLGVTF